MTIPVGFVNTLDLKVTYPLGSCEVIRVGSTPTTRTIIGPNIDTMC